MSHHGRASKERDCSLVQCPFIGHEPTTTSAVWRARTASSSAAPPQRDSERWRACAAWQVALAWHWSPYWHVAPRERAEEERPLAGAVLLLLRVRRSQPAWPGAHAPQFRVLRLLSKDSGRRRARAPRDKRSWLGVGDRSWHVASRAGADGEWPLASAVSLYWAWADHNQHGIARARSKLECCVSFPETASAGARALHDTSGAGLASDAAAGTSHHSRPSKKRGLSPTQCPFMGHTPTTTSTARRTYGVSSSAAPPHKRQ